MYDIGGVTVAVLRTILTVIFGLVCLAITVLILMQEGKQNGLGSLGGGSTETYWAKNKGRSAEGFALKATRILAFAFIILAIVLNLNF